MRDVGKEGRNVEELFLIAAELTLVNVTCTPQPRVGDGGNARYHSGNVKMPPDGVIH